MPPRRLLRDDPCVNGEDLWVCGWVLAQEVRLPRAMGNSLPSQLLTISDCIQPELPRPNPWDGDWFQERALAENAAAGMDPRPRVLTVAMHPAEARAFMDEWADEATPWFDLLRREQTLDRGESILGFEVVGAEEALDFHSWHCHGYLDDAHRDLGVGVNDLGLLPTLDEARAVLKWMSQLPPDDAPEPVPWTVVALACR